VNQQTQEALLEINKQFYEQNARSFSETRRKVQAGVRKLLATIPTNATLLDLGCGNGNFARALAESGYQGSYLGLDGSATFLQEAQITLSKLKPKAQFRFQQADISSHEWAEGLQSTSFDFITCFAVLHHIPSRQLRQAIFKQSALLLRPGGQFLISAWQVFESATLIARILPWASVGIDQSQLDQGDILLDWRAGPAGGLPARRYVHVFTSEELTALGKSVGLSLNSEFYSDGKNQRLSLYQVWVKP